MNGNEFFIDTNIFARFFVRDSEESFQECRELFACMKTGDCAAVTSSVVIAEIHWLLRSYYKISKADITAFVDRLLSMPQLRIDNRDNVINANTMFRDSSIKFTDALIASHPKIQDGSMAVISYDKDFDKLGVKRVEPAALLKQLKKGTKKRSASK